MAHLLGASVKQKILIMSTTGNRLRSEAVGWSAEDGDNILPGRPIGCSGGPKWAYTWPTPMHAIGAGWRLLAPPTKYTYNYEEGSRDEWEWWFVRDDSPIGHESWW